MHNLVAERLKFAEHLCANGLGSLEGTRWKTRERTQLIRNEVAPLHMSHHGGHTRYAPRGGHGGTAALCILNAACIDARYCRWSIAPRTSS